MGIEEGRQRENDNANRAEALCPWRQQSMQHPLNPSKENLLRTSHHFQSSNCGFSAAAIVTEPSRRKKPSNQPCSLSMLSHSLGLGARVMPDKMALDIMKHLLG